MRNISFFLFFGIVILVYFLINYYIYIRGWQALPANSGIRSWYKWIFIFLASSYLIARILERIWLSHVSDIFAWAGSFWLGIMFYLLLLVAFIDLMRLLHHFAPIYPFFLPSEPARLKLTVFAITLSTVIITAVIGYINAISPVIKTIELTIPKTAGHRSTLTIAMASDIHMGTLVGPRRTKKMATMINRQKPDLVVFAGDLVDEELAPVLRFDLGRELKKISAPLGVYAVTGNHEYIGGAGKAKKYLKDHGIIMLEDTSLLIDNSFYLAGREDRMKNSFTGQARKSLEDILRQTDMTKPVILLDHQPFDLDSVASAGIDLQLSGHTHHGQLWPLNYITRALYEISMGYKKIGTTQFYVSPGYGGWGPPMRTNSRPEVVIFRISFKTPGN